MQRTRLTKLLEKEQNITNILKIERMIFDLDCTIANLIAPIAKMQVQNIPEDTVAQTVEQLLTGNNAGILTSYSETDLLRDIVSYRKCDVLYAQKILDRIKLLGLGLFKNRGYLTDSNSYDMFGFAESRKILPDDKLQTIYTRIEQQERRKGA